MIEYAVETRQIQSIAIPPLGCGLGGLNWTAVRPRIESAFLDLPDVRTVIFCPTVMETSVSNS